MCWMVMLLNVKVALLEPVKDMALDEIKGWFCFFDPEGYMQLLANASVIEHLFDFINAPHLLEFLKA